MKCCYEMLNIIEATCEAHKAYFDKLDDFAIASVMVLMLATLFYSAIKCSLDYIWKYNQLNLRSLNTMLHHFLRSQKALTILERA